MKEFGDHWRATFPIESSRRSRRLEPRGHAQARARRSTSSRARAWASSPTRRCSSMTTPTTSQPRTRSAWKSCTSAKPVARARRARRDPRAARMRRAQARAGRVTVNGVGRERRDAHRDVLGAIGRRVLHPLARVRDDRLAGCTSISPSAWRDDHRSRQHHRVLVELRRLRGLVHPAGLRMCATLTCVVPVFTRPMYSSISFGG